MSNRSGLMEGMDDKDKVIQELVKMLDEEGMDYTNQDQMCFFFPEESREFDGDWKTGDPPGCKLIDMKVVKKEIFAFFNY